MLSFTSSSPPTCPKNGDEEAERRKTRVQRGKEININVLLLVG
jgi:hypothetical protein